MIRLSAFAVVLIVLATPAHAQSADTAIADARGLVRRAAEPFVRQSEADACVREVARALVTGRAALADLSGDARVRAADALNLTTIRAAFGRVTATRGLDVTCDLLPLAEAQGFLQLEHLTDAQRGLVLRCLTVLHGLSRRPTDEWIDLSRRALIERDLDASEADLRAMLSDPALATYLRVLAFQHTAIVQGLRARWRLEGVHRAWKLAHVSSVVDKAYVDARTPGVGPQPVAREVDLRGLPARTRTGAVLPCAVRLDVANAPAVARWDVETIDAAGARVGLVRVAPASASFELFGPSKAGRYTVLVSALLDDDRVLARAFSLEVTGPDVPVVGMDGRSLEEVGSAPTPGPAVGLAGAVAGARGAIRVSIDDVVVPGKGGSIKLDFDGSTPASFTLVLVGPGGERRVLARDEPLEASATQGSTMVVFLSAGEVPPAPSGWKVVATARRSDGTTDTVEVALSARRANRRVS